MPSRLLHCRVNLAAPSLFYSACEVIFLNFCGPEALLDGKGSSESILASSAGGIREVLLEA